MVLIPVGLSCAFTGIARNEEPRAYCIIGFVLNLLWFLWPVFAMCASLVW